MGLAATSTSHVQTALAKCVQVIDRLPLEPCSMFLTSTGTSEIRRDPQIEPLHQTNTSTHKSRNTHPTRPRSIDSSQRKKRKETERTSPSPKTEESPSPIQGLIVPGNAACVRVAQQLRHRFDVLPIRSPTVPAGTDAGPTVLERT